MPLTLAISTHASYKMRPVAQLSASIIYSINFNSRFLQDATANFH